MRPLRDLVAAADVAAHPEWRIFDCRHRLSEPDWGEHAFAQGHVPGAVHAHLDRVLSSHPGGTRGRHPLPSPEAFAGWLGAQGLRRGDAVVVYDDAGGAMAARLWWMLRWLGHGEVALLDGGLPAWLADGRPLERDVRTYAPTSYPARADAGMTVDAAEVSANLLQDDFLVVDARGAARYAGDEEPIDPVAGHIPGALNRPYTDNLDEAGRFKPAARLRAEFEALPGVADGRRIVSQCGSGVTACQQLVALAIAGIPHARLYPGSWSGWCADPARPVATGSRP